MLVLFWCQASNIPACRALLTDENWSWRTRNQVKTAFRRSWFPLSGLETGQKRGQSQEPRWILVKLFSCHALVRLLDTWSEASLILKMKRNMLWMAVLAYVKQSCWLESHGCSAHSELVSSKRKKWQPIRFAQSEPDPSWGTPKIQTGG